MVRLDLVSFAGGRPGSWLKIENMPWQQVRFTLCFVTETARWATTLAYKLVNKDATFIA